MRGPLCERSCLRCVLDLACASLISCFLFEVYDADSLEDDVINQALAFMEAFDRTHGVRLMCEEPSRDYRVQTAQFQCFCQLRCCFINSIHHMVDLESIQKSISERG